MFVIVDEKLTLFFRCHTSHQPIFCKLLVFPGFFVSLGQGVDYLYKQHSAYLIKQCIENYEIDSTFSAATNTEHVLLHRLILAPRSVVYNTSGSNNNITNGVYSGEVLTKLVDFLCSVHTQGKVMILYSKSCHHSLIRKIRPWYGLTTNVYQSFLLTLLHLPPFSFTELQVSPETENVVLLAVSELLVNLLLPLSTNNSTNTGDNTTTHPALTNAVAMLSGLVPQLLASFVYDTRWARTPALHTQRLYVLSLLLQSPLEVKVKADHVSALMGDIRSVRHGKGVLLVLFLTVTFEQLN